MHACKRTEAITVQLTLASVKFTATRAQDVTVRSRTLSDVVATVDYRANSALTLNTKYDLGTKIYTAGTTWNGKLANRVSTVKVSRRACCCVRGATELSQSNVG